MLGRRHESDEHVREGRERGEEHRPETFLRVRSRVSALGLARGGEGGWEGGR